MSFDTVDLLTGNVFQVTWDVGRRCNYDCSYCPAYRHDNFSPHASLEDLKSNTDFLFEYIDTYMQYRKFKSVSISFTGGEPTVNPNFIPFIKYLKEKYETEYSDRWETTFALTSNGAMGPAMAQKIMENMKHCTVSYHAESDARLKQQVKDRILQFHTDGPKYNFTVSVNVMFHAAYFNECKELCDWLHDQGVAYVPRIIGEEKDSRSTFSHQYTDEQLDYIKNYWKYKNAQINNEPVPIKIIEESKIEPQKEESKKKDGWAIGRPCCGSREMCVTNSNTGEERKGTFVDFRNFKGWYCSVNWFFLHLEQQTDSVYHHQTCQAKFDQTRGPIGKISKGNEILENLKRQLETNTMPTVVCPKHTCGCGLCAPKSAYHDNYTEVLATHVDMEVFENSAVPVPKTSPIIPTENM
jgi:sulfatase maturation enzyme AslB (radical SAM superfamily)